MGTKKSVYKAQCPMGCIKVPGVHVVWLVFDRVIEGLKW